MSLLKPFKAYRPKPELALEVASLPYDVINTEEAASLAKGKKWSFYHVGRPEIDLPADVDIHADAVYAKGVENLYGMIKAGVLFQEEKPCLYVYEQRMGKHVQAGIVGLVSVKEYENDLIKKHEYTRKDKEDDRTRHVTEQNANAEPVFLTYRAMADVDAIVDKVRTTKPLYDIVSEDKFGHTVWVINNEADIKRLVVLYEQIPTMYIADGHHRTASAVRYGQARRASNPKLKGEEDYEFFMAVIFPHNQLKILDYNRLVKDLNGLSKEAFLAKVAETFEVLPCESKSPKSATTFGMHLQGQWYTLKAKPDTYPAADPVKSLDVSILQDNLLAPVLGIQDPRTDKRIDFIGGIRGMGELEKRVQEGWAVAFSLYPTSLVQLMSVADAGQIMPPKSTWFEPKLRSGLLVRIYER